LKTHIIIHHSLTADGQTVSWGAIERYHRGLGWVDIGYHAGVELIGDTFYALYGRPEYQFAAACKEERMNQVGLHVCCVGNYDLVSPPDELLSTLAVRIIVPWLYRYDIPLERIMGHRDFAAYKSCPGTQFNLDKLRRLCRENL
jgi:hypothetical protein